MMSLPSVKASFINEQQLPIVYEPTNAEARSAGFLLDWIREHEQRFAEDLKIYGAVLFRGFAVPDAAAFEQVALAVDQKLVEDYPGVAARSHVTKYVHTSLELPAYYPIPQHPEMAYTPHPPRKIFFFCDVAPSSGGETPLCDLRKVLGSMPGPLRSKFEATSVRYARVHGAPSEGLYRLWGGRRWSDVFETKDRSTVELRAKAQELTLTWLPGGALKLENMLPAVRVHPLYGTSAWHNQVNTFHPDAAGIEYEQIVRHQRTLRALAVNCVVRIVDLFRRWSIPMRQFDWNVTYGDGSQISRSEVKQVNATIWKHLACFQWQRGDVVAIDNFSVSHGRLPFHGPRRILVAMTDSYPEHLAEPRAVGVLLPASAEAKQT